MEGKLDCKGPISFGVYQRGRARGDDRNTTRSRKRDYAWNGIHALSQYPQLRKSRMNELRGCLGIFGYNPICGVECEKDTI
jgi:hypothetical protein